MPIHHLPVEKCYYYETQDEYYYFPFFEIGDEDIVYISIQSAECDQANHSIERIIEFGQDFGSF